MEQHLNGDEWVATHSGRGIHLFCELSTFFLPSPGVSVRVSRYLTNSVFESTSRWHDVRHSAEKGTQGKAFISEMKERDDWGTRYGGDAVIADTVRGK